MGKRKDLEEYFLEVEVGYDKEGGDRFFQVPPLYQLA